VVADTTPAEVDRPTRADITIHWILRAAVATEFFGHGAFGIMGKDAWLPYYHLFGIGDQLARTLMPVNGMVDLSSSSSVPTTSECH
jgi:hypothetical protein